jgi:hypothetical protein
LRAGLYHQADFDVAAGLKYALDRPHSYARRLRKYAKIHAEQIELAAARYMEGEHKEH